MVQRTSADGQVRDVYSPLASLTSGALACYLGPSCIRRVPTSAFDGLPKVYLCPLTSFFSHLDRSLVSKPVLTASATFDDCSHLHLRPPPPAFPRRLPLLSIPVGCNLPGGPCGRSAGSTTCLGSSSIIRAEDTHPHLVSSYAVPYVVRSKSGGLS